MLRVDQHEIVVGGAELADAHQHGARRAPGPAWRRGSPRCPSVRTMPPPLPPVDRQKLRGREIACREQHGARAACARREPQRAAQHPIANVPQVGAARAEIGVLGGFVAGDFGVQRRGPGRHGVRSFGDRCKRRRRKRLVLEHRHLELENGRAIVVGARIRPAIRGGCPQSSAPRGWPPRAGVAARSGKRSAIASSVKQRAGRIADRGDRAGTLSVGMASPSSKSRSDQCATRAAIASSASGPSARKNSIAPLGALVAITLTIDLASIQGPPRSGPDRCARPKPLASLVSFTDGRAWRPTSCVINHPRFGERTFSALFFSR